MAITSDENVRLLIEAWKLMVGRLPGGVNTQADGVATMCANVALPFFNLSTPERRAAACGMPPEMFECICNMHIWHKDSYAYVGYVDGRAVTSAATLPEACGKGYAEAVMREAIGHAGGGRITLHASDAGQPLYRAMGFEPGGRMMILGPAH